MNKPYNILCLDGGGSWDIIQAMALEKIYGDIPGHEILAKFDLVVANSGGSLVAAALAEGLRPTEIRALIKNETIRRGIFSSLSFLEEDLLEHIANLEDIGPKYSAERKLKGLNAALPKTTGLYMSELPALISTGAHVTHFMICGFDYERERAVFFRSDRNSKAQGWKIEQSFDPTVKDVYKDVYLHEAIHASSNAPVNYFDKPAEFAYRGDTENSYFWDGAVGGFNNPILVAIIEARCNGINNDDIRVLSIGTGNNFLPLLASDSAIGCEYPWLAIPFEKPSLLKDIPKLAKSILSDPPDSDTFIAYTMLFPDLPRKQNRFVRLNPLVQPIKRIMDGKEQWTVPEGFISEEFYRLILMDMDAIAQEDVLLIEKFCEQWFIGNIKNQPVRAGSQLECILGHPYFEEGMNAWNSDGSE